MVYFVMRFIIRRKEKKISNRKLKEELQAMKKELEEKMSKGEQAK